MAYEPSNTIRGKIILALVDHPQGLSSKRLRKYLNAKSSQINPITMKLRKQGLVEHTGYAHFALTEAGRKAAGGMMATCPEPEPVTETITEADRPQVSLRVVAEMQLTTDLQKESVDYIAKLLRRRKELEVKIADIEDEIAKVEKDGHAPFREW